MRRSLFVMIFLGVAWVPSAAVAEVSEFPVYSGDEFKEMYDHAVRFELPRLELPDSQIAITGNEELDARIWSLAFRRGYVLRPVASGGLTTADGVKMQPEAAAAWEKLKSAARDAGLSLLVVSAYRSPAEQKANFLARLQGNSDQAIEEALRWRSIPGTSKHHSGYALDFGNRNSTFTNFRTTPDYSWLVKNNFYNAKKFGFIPSYPDDVSSQGPNPEPWEFVWVGVEMIRCGTPVEAYSIGPVRGPASQIVAEVARCPGVLITPGEAVEGLPTWWHRVR